MMVLVLNCRFRSTFLDATAAAMAMAMAIHHHDSCTAHTYTCSHVLDACLRLSRLLRG
jgi:hypothetical protein